jgi:hypothetical protein
MYLILIYPVWFTIKSILKLVLAMNVEEASHRIDSMVRGHERLGNFSLTVSRF